MIRKFPGPSQFPENIKGRKKTINQTFCERKWPVSDPLFDPQTPPKKFMWVPFLPSFP